MQFSSKVSARTTKFTKAKILAIVSADKADAALKFIRARKRKVWLIGEVVKGKGEARVIGI